MSKRNFFRIVSCMLLFFIIFSNSSKAITLEQMEKDAQEFIEAGRESAEKVNWSECKSFENERKITKILFQMILVITIGTIIMYYIYTILEIKNENIKKLKRNCYICICFIILLFIILAILCYMYSVVYIGTHGFISLNGIFTMFLLYSLAVELLIEVIYIKNKDKKIIIHVASLEVSVILFLILTSMCVIFLPIISIIAYLTLLKLILLPLKKVLKREEVENERIIVDEV